MLLDPGAVQGGVKKLAGVDLANARARRKSKKTTVHSLCATVPGGPLRYADRTHCTVGGSMSEAIQPQTGQTPTRLLFSGVAIGVVGASVKKHAESVGELVAALAIRTYSSDVAVAAALGQAGLALLVAGAVVALAGLVMIGLADQRQRRRCAMDPQRCSVACHDLTSAPPSPSEPSRRCGGAKAA
jgi:hypothetical protein